MLLLQMPEKAAYIHELVLLFKEGRMYKMQNMEKQGAALQEELAVNEAYGKADGRIIRDRMCNENVIKEK